MVARAEGSEVPNENILRFWNKKMVGAKGGGFYGQMEGNGALHEDADKGVILNTRILRTFSAAFNPHYSRAHRSVWY